MELLINVLTTFLKLKKQIDSNTLHFLIHLQEDSDPQIHESLSIENTLWASTVVASGE